MIEAAEFVVTEAENEASLEEIMRLLKVRFGNEHQAERFRAEMRSRRRRAGEPLQTLYQDLCRLKLLAFGHSLETEFSKLYLRDVFLDALNDMHLRKLILMQEPHSIEEALRLACRLEAIDSSGMLENISDSHRHKHRLHQLEMDSTNESGSKEINKQLGEMRNALHNVRQEIAHSKVDSHPPLGSSVQGVGLSSANYSEDVRSSETLGRYNLTRVRRQPVESGMEGASGMHKGACFYCKENGHWCRECPHKKHWNHDMVRRDGSYGQTGMNSARTGTLSGDFAVRPGRAQEQSERSPGDASDDKLAQRNVTRKGRHRSYTWMCYYILGIYVLHSIRDANILYSVNGCCRTQYWNQLHIFKNKCRLRFKDQHFENLCNQLQFLSSQEQF